MVGVGWQQECQGDPKRSTVCRLRACSLAGRGHSCSQTHLGNQRLTEGAFGAQPQKDTVQRCLYFPQFSLINASAFIHQKYNPEDPHLIYDSAIVVPCLRASRLQALLPKHCSPRRSTHGMMRSVGQVGSIPGTWGAES